MKHNIIVYKYHNADLNQPEPTLLINELSELKFNQDLHIYIPCDLKT